MCKIKSLLLNLTICLAGIVSFAQKAEKPDQYRAVQWTVEKGLNNDIMNVMLKDAKGFLWIGNVNGDVSRFDGAHFKNFLPDPKKHGAINAGQVTAFVEDSLHNIWMATYRGLSRFDIQTELFTNFAPTVDSSTSDNPIIPFWSTSTHIYCFESRTRLVTFDIRSLEKKTVVASSKPFNNYNSFYVLMHAILDSTSNSVWILYPSHEEGANGLLQISLKDGKQTIYPWPIVYPGRFRKDAESMKMDSKRNSIWINTPSGLFEFSLKSKQYRVIDVLNEITKAKDYDRCVGIDLDKQGRVWFATNPQGIFIYDPKTNQAYDWNKPPHK